MLDIFLFKQQMVAQLLELQISPDREPGIPNPLASIGWEFPLGLAAPISKTTLGL